MFVRSKAPWYAITGGLPEYDEFPPEFAMPATLRATIPVRPGVTHGSCLCGAVTYEMIGTPLRMFYCHCSRCREGRSAAHCANVFFKSDGFSWTRGSGDVQEYASRAPSSSGLRSAVVAAAECRGFPRNAMSHRYLPLVGQQTRN